MISAVNSVQQSPFRVQTNKPASKSTSLQKNGRSNVSFTSDSPNLVIIWGVLLGLAAGILALMQKAAIRDAHRHGHKPITARQARIFWALGRLA